MGDWQVTGAGVVGFGVGLAMKKKTLGADEISG